jgi:uncharacterized protein (DUF1697 family)
MRIKDAHKVPKACSPMPSYIALIRAVNVGGTGKLPMTTLTEMCVEAGLESVRTYIASGNVVFTTRLEERAIRAALETRLERFAGKPVGVLVRTAAEMASVLKANPFKKAPANRTVAIFLNEAPPQDIIAQARGRTTEKLAVGAREIYVAYDNGMAKSRLRIPGAELGTARNINTVAKLAAMAAALTAPGESQKR